MTVELASASTNCTDTNSALACSSEHRAYSPYLLPPELTPPPIHPMACWLLLLSTCTYPRLSTPLSLQTQALHPKAPNLFTAHPEPLNPALNPIPLRFPAQETGALQLPEPGIGRPSSLRRAPLPKALEVQQSWFIFMAIKRILSFV